MLAHLLASGRWLLLVPAEATVPGKGVHTVRIMTTYTPFIVIHTMYVLKADMHVST